MLTRDERLKYNGLFLQAYQKGKTLYSKNFKINYTKTREDYVNRLPFVGFVVGKSFSKSAVIRNRLKRQIREAYRLFRMKAENAKKLEELGLLVIGIKKNFDSANFHEIKNELDSALENIIK